MNNNVKYLILGKEYDSTQIKDILYSKLIFTYRSNFPKIRKTYITNDIGWGCTIRSGQMLIGNTLIRKKFGLDWIYNKSIISDEYLKIIYEFQDNYNGNYSFHNIISHYDFIGKNPGEWIGPYSFCKILEKISKNLEKSKIYYYNFVDSEFNLDTIRESESDISYLITFPVRLGLKEINNMYYDNLKYLIKLKYFNGIIGGTNNASYFFTGLYMNTNLIYFDPHNVNNYNFEQNIENEYHTTDINYLEIENLSPTFSISFYCNNYKDLLELKENLENIPDKRYQIITNYLSDKRTFSYKISDENNSNDDWEFID